MALPFRLSLLAAHLLYILYPRPGMVRQGGGTSRMAPQSTPVQGWQEPAMNYIHLARTPHLSYHLYSSTPHLVIMQYVCYAPLTLTIPTDFRAK